MLSDDAPPFPGAPPFCVDDIISFNAILSAMPGKTCDVGANCGAGAAWYVDQHGCDQLTACDEHRRQWLYELNEAVSQGWAICPECKGEFTSVADIMEIRPI